VQFETQEDATKALQRAHMTLVNIFLTMLLVKMAWLYFSFLDQMINIL
jgi:hypothetical protein